MSISGSAESQREGFLNNRKDTTVILVILGLALAGSYTLYKPFLLPMIVALLLVMATYDLSKYLTKRFGSRSLSAVAMTCFLALIIFAPIIYIATIGVGYATQIDKEMIKEMIHTADRFLDTIPFVKNWGGEYFNEEKIISYIQESTYYLTSLGSAGLGFMKNMFLVIIFYLAINFYSDRLFDLICSLIPIARGKSAKIINEVSSMMEVVFYSTIAVAVFEGFLFGVMVSWYGFDGLLFGIIYGFFSLIPVAGGLLVWLPVALYSWNKIDAHAAWFIALYSVIIISVVADTFIKPVIIKLIKTKFLKSTNEINELIIFFSMIAGIGSYGIWGMIIGPAITSFLIAISKVYIEHNKGYFRQSSEE